MKNHRLSAFLMMLTVSLIWGMAGPVIKYTLGYLNPLTFLTYRFFLSALIAFVFAARYNHRLPKEPSRIIQMLFGGFLSVPVTLGLLFFGYNLTTSISGTVITTVAPLFVVFLGAVFLHDRVTHKEKMGIGLALIGTMVISVSPLLNGGTADRFGNVEGNLIIILAMMAEAVAILYTKMSVRNHVPADVHTHASFVLGFAVMLPITLFFASPQELWQSVTTAPLGAHMGVLYMAVLSGTVAYMLRNRAIKTMEISESAVFSYLLPLWGAPLSILWLNEHLSVSFIAGAVVIAAGVALSEYRVRKRNGTAKKGPVRRQKR